jgi:hypothetical protein
LDILSDSRKASIAQILLFLETDLFTCGLELLLLQQTFWDTKVVLISILPPSPAPFFQCWESNSGSCTCYANASTPELYPFF